MFLKTKQITNRIVNTNMLHKTYDRYSLYIYKDYLEPTLYCIEFYLNTCMKSLINYLLNTGFFMGDGATCRVGTCHVAARF
jgi:poly-beta-hydroxyalkanoate depolymerase